MKMSMLKPIAPDLFSLRDSSTGVATQWRAASSAFQDMEAMRDERITHEMSCVGNHMRRCNKIKCMDQRTRKYRKRVETSCSGTKHAKERHIHHVSENCGCVYKQRSSTTSPSTFMPESATLPCMRHLLAYLSRTLENHHLAIYLKTPFLMNCDCLTFSCY